LCTLQGKGSLYFSIDLFKGVSVYDRIREGEKEGENYKNSKLYINIQTVYTQTYYCNRMLPRKIGKRWLEKVNSRKNCGEA